MFDSCTYSVEVKGRVDERVFNAASPVQATVTRHDEAATLLSICADQAGLIGLMRHLHAQGFVLLSVTRQ